MAATIKPDFHHVTLKTTRLPQMVEWYKTLVRTEVLFQDDSNGLDLERRGEPSKARNQRR